MAQRTHIDRSRCRDCGTVEGMGWSEERGPGYAKSGGAYSRCYSCYLRYCREGSYRRGKARGPKLPAVRQHEKDRLIPRTCRLCGSFYSLDDVGRGIWYCTPTCSAMALRDRNRRKSVKRRTTRARVDAVPYTLFDIAERDRWRCHVCGKKVRMISGSKPAGPTVDHLIPLIDGGPDAPHNVALAHRRCNIKRGVGGITQLRLVG